MFLPQRLLALTSIHLSFQYWNLLHDMGFSQGQSAKIAPQKVKEWIHLWRALASLPLLKRIQVDFTGKPIYYDESDRAIFQPLIAFDKPLLEFDVCSPWVMQGLPSDVPFRLVQVAQ